MSAPWLSAFAQGETRLIRSGKGGATIHLRGCKRASPYQTWPWIWAEGKPDREWAGMLWLKPCAYCLPDVAAMRDEAIRFERRRGENSQARPES